MGRETVETEVTETVTQEVIICDVCGGEAESGEVLLPIDRRYWDALDNGQPVARDTAYVAAPLHRCADCRATAPEATHFPDSAYQTEPNKDRPHADTDLPTAYLEHKHEEMNSATRLVLIILVCVASFFCLVGLLTTLTLLL